MKTYYKLYTIDGIFLRFEESYFNAPTEKFSGILEWISDGSKAWYIEGKLHRLDGAAYILTHVKKDLKPFESYYIDNKKVSQKEHKLLVDLMNLKGII